ncbi:MAG: S8 family serine peptidase, partial [Mycobacteriales bacterium]
MSRTRLAVLAATLVGLAATPSAWAAGRSQDITWDGNQIHLYAAQSAGREGADVTVAVLDGWVDRSHPDFEGRALPGADCTSGTCVPGQQRDACTHGTHVAGTVASSSFGVATRATVLPVRVLTDDGKGGCTGTPADVAAGIHWAVAHGARVLNLSLGPDVPGIASSGAIPTAVHDAAVAGAVVVFSAGNADLPLAQAYGSDALVVAATAPSGRLADYSQYGAGVSVAAPGGQPDASGHCTQATCITSLYPDGQYAVAAGTSMAAPHVSGLAALLIAQQPSRTRQQVMDRITGTAQPLAGAGSGLIDVRAALGVVVPTPRPVATPAPRTP